MTKTAKNKSKAKNEAPEEEVSKESPAPEEQPSESAEEETAPVPEEAPQPQMPKAPTARPTNDTSMSCVRAFRGALSPLERAFLTKEQLLKVPRRLTRKAWRAEFEAFKKKERR